MEIDLPSDQELADIYDVEFDVHADRATTEAGQAHLAALRAVFIKGVEAAGGRVRTH